MIPIYPTIAEVRTAVAEARQAGKRIGFVPTMGALHAGHAALVRAAKRTADCVAVSIFVNPTQFGPKEDFQKYPRNLEADRLLCERAGAGFIFAPNALEMYPENAKAIVEVPGLDAVLCGPRRPGHFRGVCTVVMKLFNIVQPDEATFGAKDAQQSILLKKMVSDLNLPIRMNIEPTIREADGLAMSSRNRYLSEEHRLLAPRIYAALQEIAERVHSGETDVARLESALQVSLISIPGSRMDYAEIRDFETLEAIAKIERPALAAVAVFLGGTRLIDNVTLG